MKASYVGAVGRRLLQTAQINTPNATFFRAQLVSNTATSDYHALQIQYQRRLSHGLQALASYAWSHSIDTASSGSFFGNQANALVPGINPNTNRGPSDFDIRNAFSAGLTYDIPLPKTKAYARSIVRGWSLESVFQARSSAPESLYYSQFSTLLSATAHIRPDRVPGQPLYLIGSQFPGGKAFNPVAFTKPPVDPTTHLPTRQGNLGRNALKGFGATQWDFAVHRDFPIREWLKLQFRAEMFNVLNHPNFGPPVANLNNTAQFGKAIAMLGQSLNQNAGAGSFSALYQIGGPRSIQFALKLMF
jgi:hypothetical protein